MCVIMVLTLIAYANVKEITEIEFNPYVNKRSFIIEFYKHYPNTLMKDDLVISNYNNSILDYFHKLAKRLYAESGGINNEY